MNTATAMKAGAMAFAEGRAIAPSMNQAFLRAACAEPQSGELFVLLDAYIRGWTTAHLAKDAPLPTMPSVAALAKIMAAE